MRPSFVSLPSSSSRSCLLGVALIAAFGCKQAEPAPPPAKAPELTAAPSPAPEPEPQPPAQPPAATESTDKPGWSKVLMEDSLPLCVFPSYEAREASPPFPNVKKQALKADAPVVFGVYGPWCLNVACDERLLLQCWTEREGTTLTVHTRFASLHKDGSDCTTDCMVVDAACETPALEAGEYTIRHGDKTSPLKVPSVVRAPCFDPKAAAPGTSKSPKPALPR